jgi:4-carboxymuconolactone decarboxylase
MLSGTSFAAIDRMPPLAPDAFTPAQKAAAASTTKGVPPGSPARPMATGPILRSPELLTRLAYTGAYLRYDTDFDRKLNEFATMITLRHWECQFEWPVHEKNAINAGLQPAIAKAIAEGQRPVGMAPDEEKIYDFLDELHRNRSVSDATYQRVQQRWGDRSVVDLVALDGYYSTVAAILSVAQTPMPAGMSKPLPHLPR